MSAFATALNKPPMDHQIRRDDGSHSKTVAHSGQSIHDELDAGIIESVRMLRGLVADAPPVFRVRAATALMDRAGLTPAYAIEVRHKADHDRNKWPSPRLKMPSV